MRIKDYNLEVSRSRILKQSKIIIKGRNSVITTSSRPEDVWNGGSLYTGFPDNAETLEIKSSSDNDAVGESGAWTAVIENLLDEDGVLMPDIIVSLDGQNWVSLGPIEYWRTAQARVLTAGSSGHNEGELTVRQTTTTANIMAVMPAEGNETAIAAYTVPFGCEAHINVIGMQISKGNGTLCGATCTIRAREHGSVFQSKLYPTIGSGAPFDYDGEYLDFPALTDIVQRVDDVSDSASIVTGHFTGKLISVL